MTIKSFSSQNYLARNFYNMRFLALFVCFAINFILLFYKVTCTHTHTHTTHVYDFVYSCVEGFVFFV